MREVETCGLPYLFKLRLTKNVARMIEKLGSAPEWIYAGHGFQAKESAVRLVGWSRERRVIVLRRRLKGAVGLSYDDENGAPRLSFAEIDRGGEAYEYSVLVTTLDEEMEAFGQLYRDRGDAENIFDETKNQWGWGGFTTHDLARCRLTARLVALFYDWWNIFVRLAEPSSRGDHQPAAVSIGHHRDAHAARAADDAPRDERARKGETRGASAGGGRGLPARPGRKCGAVDRAAKMARDPVAGLPGLPERPPAARPAPPGARLMQPHREKSNHAERRPANCGF